MDVALGGPDRQGGKSEDMGVSRQIFHRLFGKYQQVFEEYVEAAAAFEATETEYSPESKRMLKLMNKLAFMREELWLESDVEEVRSVEDLVDDEVYCDLKSNFVYTGKLLKDLAADGMDLEALVEGRDLVRLSPSSISGETRDKRDGILEALKSRKPEVRQQALVDLKEMLDLEEIKPHKVEFELIHCHTTESFSPYTMEGFVARAVLLGIETIGFVDHDTLLGAQAFFEACRTMDIKNPVYGCELRFTMPRDIEYNSPRNRREAYFAVQGGPADLEEILATDVMLKPVRREKIERFRRTLVDFNGMWACADNGVHVDLDRDILPLTERWEYDRENVNPTERHVAQGISDRMFQSCGDDQPKVIGTLEQLITECRRKVADSDVPEEVKIDICRGEILSSDEKAAITDVDSAVVVVREKVVKALRQLHPPTEAENLPVEEGVAMVKSRGWDPFYLLLDGETCEAERPENLPVLVQELLDILVAGVGIITNRINGRTTKRVYPIFSDAFLAAFIINGLDVNAPGMTFTWPTLIDFSVATGRLIRRLAS